MEINLNNQKEDFPTEGIQCFGQLMESLSKRAADEGGSVLTVRLNGEDITGRDRTHLEELPLTDIEELEIQTGDPKNLARSTLYSIADFHEQLLRELQSTAELFRLGNDERSNQSFLRCIDGLQVFMHSLESCRKLLGISFELLFIPGSDGQSDQSVAESRRKLFAVLDNMFDAQTDQDWVLLADMLEYELTPALEDWRQIIYTILEQTTSDQIVEVGPELVEAQSLTLS